MTDKTNVPYLHPSLGVEAGSIAEASHMQDFELAKLIRETLDANIPAGDAIEDFSANQNGSIIIGGRFIASDNRAFYWMVRDNRLHIMPSFKHLSSEQDKMQCLNQALVAYAGRSNKADLKSAAIAVTEEGHFYIAHNTAEVSDWNKECAEVNLGVIVKQLGKPDDKVKRVYVLGGLTDAFKQGHINDQLVGMCMRCVAGLMGLMGLGATVTIVPANDGKASIGLRETHAMAHVKANEAWQVPYAALVEPSIIHFDADVKHAEKIAFDVLQTGRGMHPVMPLTEGNTPRSAQEINAFMAAHMASELRHKRGELDSVAMTVVEIQQGDQFRYEYTFEPVGAEYNALLSPVSRAGALSRPFPKTSQNAHINRIFFTGYNADGSDYICNPEQWDRAIKRTLLNKSPSVTFIPLNDGVYPKEHVVVKPLDALVPTAYRGSKQPEGCCR